MASEIELFVAKALTRWMNSKKNPDEAVWETLSEEVQNAYIDQARAAISAVRTFDARGQDWKQVAPYLYSLAIPEGTLYKSARYTESSSITFVPKER